MTRVVTKTLLRHLRHDHVGRHRFPSAVSGVLKFTAALGESVPKAIGENWCG